MDANLFFYNIATQGIASRSIIESVDSQLSGRVNGPADAYRHLLLSAELTRQFGEGYARMLLDSHEWTGSNGGQHSDEEAMDRHNNEIGIKIGNELRDNPNSSWDDVVKKVRESIDSTNNDGDGGRWLTDDRWDKNPVNPETGERFSNDDPRLNWPPSWLETSPNNTPPIVNDFVPPEIPIPIIPPPDFPYIRNSPDGRFPCTPYDMDGDGIPDIFKKIIKDLKDKFDGAEIAVSPLIFDLDGDGVETVSLAANIYFDHDGNGFAESTGWVGADDGLLVWDRNGNGIIDDGSELFGSQALLANGSKAANGFLALAELDSNGDGVIDGSDADWANLRVWQDSDQNAVTDEGELITLSEAGIASLNLDYINSTHIDSAGNAHKQVGSFVRTDGTTGAATDVWFKADYAFTREVYLVDVSAAITALPDLPGFGNVRSLHQAMARDETGNLQGLVTQYVAETSSSVRDSLLNQIIYHWAGVQNVSSSSRGTYIDGRKIATLEAFLGELYRDSGASVPGINAAAQLETAYRELKKSITDMLMIQSHLEPLISDIELVFDEDHGSLVLGFQGVLNTLEILYASQPTYASGLAYEFINLVYHHNLVSIPQLVELISDFCEIMPSLVGTQFLEGINFFLGSLDNDSMSGGGSRDILYGGDGNDSLSAGDGDDTLHGGAGDDILIGGNGNDLLYGNEGDDLLEGNNGNDTLHGYDGNDTLAGGDGNDLIYGGNGDDVLDGGNGLDTLYGGAGDDTLISPHAGTGTHFHGGVGNDTLVGSGRADYFHFERGDGSDTIDERARYSSAASSENDRIYLGQGITPDEVVLTRSGTDLLIRVGDGDNEIRVLAWYESGYNQIQELRFADGTIWNVDTLHAKGLALYGTADNDVLEGLTSQMNVLYGYDGNDTLLAGTRPDTLYGGAGDDTLISPHAGTGTHFHGGIGNDTLVGSGRADYFHFERGDGNDTIDERARYSSAASSEGDRIYLGQDIAPDDVTIIRDGIDLLIRVGDEDNEIRVLAWYESSYHRIEELRFIDGTIWNISTLHGMGLARHGGAGDDTLESLDGHANRLYGNDGNDTLIGGTGQDALYGGDGNDTLVGGTGQQSLYGGAGNDVLSSPFTSNTITSFHGGTGDDLLVGSGRGDYYYFNLGDEQDTIDERGRHTSYLENDRIYLGEGIGGQDVVVTRDGVDLLILVGDGSDQIRVLAWYESGLNRIGELRFADGTIWNESTLHTKGLAVYGGEGNDELVGLQNELNKLHGGDGDDILMAANTSDSLYGGAGNDVLQSPFDVNGVRRFEGGEGNDLLIGSGRGDYYHFNRGDGQDTIDERGRHTNYAENDRLYLKGDIAPEDVELSRDGLDLLIKIGDGSDQIRVLAWYDPSGMNRISELRFADGMIWDQSTVHSRGLAVYGGAGNDELVGLQNEMNKLYGGDGDDFLMSANTSDSLYGGAGNDVLQSPFDVNGVRRFEGGEGNDLLIGSGRGDYYHFNRGDGQDTIDERGRHTNYSENDRLYLKGDIAPNEVSTTRDGLDLLIKIGDGSDQIRVLAWYDPSAMNRISELRFVDGTIWDQSALHTKGLTLHGNNTDELLEGIVGQANTMHGHGGNDTLNGSTVSDKLYGGEGDDILNGNNGNDTLVGGTGNDLLEGGAGSDRYLFGSGDRQDRIVDYQTTTNTDVLQFTDDIRADQIWFARAGNDLVVSLIGTEDAVTVADWYLGSAYRVEEIKTFDGILLHTKVEALVNAMAAFTPPPLGETALPEEYHTALIGVMTSNWQIV